MHFHAQWCVRISTLDSVVSDQPELRRVVVLADHYCKVHQLFVLDVQVLEGALMKRNLLESFFQRLHQGFGLRFVTTEFQIIGMGAQN